MADNVFHSSSECWVLVCLLHKNLCRLRQEGPKPTRIAEQFFLSQINKQINNKNFTNSLSLSLGSLTNYKIKYCIKTKPSYLTLNLEWCLVGGREVPPKESMQGMLTVWAVLSPENRGMHKSLYVCCSACSCFSVYLPCCITHF